MNIKELYKWVPPGKDIAGDNLTLACDRLASHPGGVEIHIHVLLLTSCHKNRMSSGLMGYLAHTDFTYLP